MNPRPTALRRALAVVLGLILATAAALAAPTAVAATEPLVTVELTSVTVTGPAPTDRVELRGRVSNPGGAQVYGLRMALWRSRNPIDDLAGVRQAAAVSSPGGFILDGGIHTLFAEGEPFPAGGTAEFQLTATLDDLGFDAADRAYLVGARALATTQDSGGNYGRVGQAVTLMTVPDQQQVPVTRLVILSAPPSKLSADVFANEDLVEQLQGRLDTLLNAARSPGMSWLVDPSLYDEVADMADGYQVLADGALTPGTGEKVAADWLARFRQLDQRAGGRTLFANPDLTTDNDDVLTRALQATRQVSQLDGLPLVVVPAGRVYADITDTAPAQLGDAPQLATNLETPGALQSAPDGRRVLASAVSLGTGQPGLEATQLVLAETLVTGAAGQVRVLAEPGDLVADRATTASWMTSRLLGDLLGQEPTGAARFTEVLPATLTPDQFDAAEDLKDDFAAYRELAPESTITQDSSAALTRVVSTAWITDPEGQADLLAGFDDLVGPKALSAAVTLDVSPRFVMSGRTNQFPMTLTNNLSEPIRVKVVVTTDNPQRLSIPDTDVISIQPGQSETVTVQPEANGNGVVTARAWVETQDGQRVTDAPITIEMTQLGFIGWVIVIISGLVVVAATALRIRQVRRKAAAADLTAGDPPDPASAAPPDEQPTTASAPVERSHG